MKYLKSFLFIVGITSFVTSCITDDLTYERDKQAKHISVVEYVKPSIRKKLAEIDQVKCHLGENYRTLSANQTSCKNFMANIAFKMGGSHVICDKTRQDISPSVSGNFYCSSGDGEINCINTTIPKGASNIVDFTCLVYKNKDHSTKTYDLAQAEAEEKAKSEILAESLGVKYKVTYDEDS